MKILTSDNDFQAAAVSQASVTIYQRGTTTIIPGGIVEKHSPLFVQVSGALYNRHIYVFVVETQKRPD